MSNNQVDHISMMNGTATQLLNPITNAIMANVPTLIHGHPAIGKSDFYKQIAKNNNLLLVDVRLTTVDPVSLNGALAPNADRTRAGFLPTDLFPMGEYYDKQGNLVPADVIPTNLSTGKPYDGFLVLLDEITQIPPTMQAMTYSILLDHTVGGKPLHPKAYVCAAGNLISSGAVAYKGNTAMGSRMVHAVMTPDLPSWKKWAAQQSIDPRIIAWISHNPDMFYNFKKDSGEFTFSSPRTLEMLSKQTVKLTNDQIKGKDIDWVYMPKLIQGTVGSGAKTDFMAFMACFDMLPDLADILANPQTAQVPTDLGSQYACSSMLGTYMGDPTTSAADLDSIFQYMNRIGNKQIQAVVMQVAVGKNMLLMQNHNILAWVQANKALFQ